MMHGWTAQRLRVLGCVGVWQLFAHQELSHGLLLLLLLCAVMFFVLGKTTCLLERSMLSLKGVTVMLPPPIEPQMHEDGY